MEVTPFVSHFNIFKNLLKVVKDVCTMGIPTGFPSIPPGNSDGKLFFHIDVSLSETDISLSQTDRDISL